MGTAQLGKIDYVVARHEKGTLADFCALEVQSVYMSGSSMRPEFEHYLRTGAAPEPQRERHADYRSSSHKRLMPQLMIKVPALRRWGKKVLVAIHQDFFGWLPECPVLDESNAELTWLVYRAEDQGDRYRLAFQRTVPTTLEDAVTSLTAAVPPPRQEFERQLQAALRERLDGNELGY
ncbi:MAG: NotI family restriction endonuclease [bacterium]